MCQRILYNKSLVVLRGAKTAPFIKVPFFVFVLRGGEKLITSMLSGVVFLLFVVCLFGGGGENLITSMLSGVVLLLFVFCLF